MIILGDTSKVLKEFNDNSIDCVITSPPYWGLRDYKTEGQLGLEPTFQEYINKLVAIFDEVKRILKKEGTCWVVISDTYSAAPTGSRSFGSFIAKRTLTGGYNSLKAVYEAQKLRRIPDNIPQKSLCLIPQRFAIAMLDHGWVLRNDIIWYKPNCMPSSATDRFTVDYEHIFFFTKSQNYYFETQYEPHLSQNTGGRREQNKNLIDKGQTIQSLHKPNFIFEYNHSGRIKRTVWKITTQAYPEAHFAVFPEEVVKTPILAGCPEGGIVLDPFTGSGTTLKAAHQLNRKWIGIEINPDYVQLAKKRLTPYVQQQRLDQFTIAERDNSKLRIPSLP